jgi:hypothetical protein
MPDPIAPTPAPNQSNCSGGGWIQTPSGTASSGLTTSGDFAYYTQTSRIQYTRKPIYVQQWGNNSTYNITLSQASAVQPITASEFVMIIDAKVTCTKITQPLTASSYEQKQKFKISGKSVDQYGNSYGTVSGFLFGPQGSVDTIQPWIFIRPWNNDFDSEYNQSLQGYSYGRGLSSCDNIQWLTVNMIMTKDFADFLKWDDEPNWKVSYDFVSNQTNTDEYRMYGGGYATSSEDAWNDLTAGRQRLISFLETNCDLLSPDPNGNNQANWCTMDPQKSDGYLWIQSEDRLYLPHYSTIRHDYT